MSRSKKPSKDDGHALSLSRIRFLDEISEAERLVTALQYRQAECPALPPPSYTREALAKFDSLDLAGKRAMLGEFWPKWRKLVESGAV